MRGDWASDIYVYSRNKQDLIDMKRDFSLLMLYGGEGEKFARIFFPEYPVEGSEYSEFDAVQIDGIEKDKDAGWKFHVRTENATEAEPVMFAAILKRYAPECVLAYRSVSPSDSKGFKERWGARNDIEIGDDIDKTSDKNNFASEDAEYRLKTNPVQWKTGDIDSAEFFWEGEPFGESDFGDRGSYAERTNGHKYDNRRLQSDLLYVLRAGALPKDHRSMYSGLSKEDIDMIRKNKDVFGLFSNLGDDKGGM